MSNKSLDARLRAVKETAVKKQKYAQGLIPPKALQNQMISGESDNHDSIDKITEKDTEVDTTSSLSSPEGALRREDDGERSMHPQSSQSSPETHSKGDDGVTKHITFEDKISAIQQRIDGNDTNIDRRSEPVQTTPTHSEASSTAYSDPVSIPYRPKRYKKQRLVDTHEQKSYYMEKEIVQIIDELAGDDTGFKYRFVNEAVRLLLHQDYPHLVHRLRPQSE